MYNIIQHAYNKIKRKFDIKKALYKATFGIFMILQLSNYRLPITSIGGFYFMSIEIAV